MCRACRSCGKSKKLLFYAEESIRDLPEGTEIETRFPSLQWIEDYQKFRRENMRKEKECVIFAKKRGVWLKPFSCYHSNRNYKYYSLDVAEGCLFDCVYCYLQTYLNHGALVLFVDQQSLLAELQDRHDGNLWISTGLLSDSLLAESLLPILPRLSIAIPGGSVLELRSKSNDLSSLHNSGIRRSRVVISWSLNPHRIAMEYEYGTASPEQRFDAAKEAISLGYRVAFHLDPVFHFEGWQSAYKELFTTIGSFNPEQIAFLSIGLFRYMPDLGASIRRRFPYHQVLTGEFFPDADGKYHYLRTIRKEMYSAFSEWLKPCAGNVPVFWAMEPDRRLLRTED